MLELDIKWFLVLLLNFLGLLYILNIILFRPLLKVFKERDDSIKNSLEAAKEMNGKKEAAIVRMNQELQEARGKAKEIFENMRKEGANRQKEILEAAGKQSQDFIGRARGELKAEAGKAREKLRSDVERFSEEIVRKLVGA